MDFDGNEKAIKTEFIRIGKQLIGDKFTVRKEAALHVTDLLRYFTGNEGNLDLTKGIYLHGNFGVGKTTIFSVIRQFLAVNAPVNEFGKRYNPNGFQLCSIEQIIETYKSDGNLDYYGYRKEATPFHLCINEFGKSVNEKIYGTEAGELINSLFMIRYELFQREILTHCTSNFHPRELKVEKIIADRMNEMFNFIEINGESFRK